MRRTLLALAVLAVLGVAIGWGWQAVAVYAFFASGAAAVTFAAGLGGDWLRDASRRRFDDRQR